jgi:hypothetical protein
MIQYILCLLGRHTPFEVCGGDIVCLHCGVELSDGLDRLTAYMCGTPCLDVSREEVQVVVGKLTATEKNKLVRMSASERVGYLSARTRCGERIARAVARSM